MRRIRYGPIAESDLASIFEFIARDNPRAAAMVRQRLVALIEGLATFATGREGRIRGTFDKVAPGLPYIVTYSIFMDEDGEDTIRILTVRHTSRRPLGADRDR